MKRALLALLPLLILVGLVAVFAMNMDRDPSLVRSVLINKPAPVTELPAVEGLDRPGITPALLTGQVSVVNVFASWCVPCRDEHPVLMELRKRTGVQLIGINQKDAPENARAFLAELGNPYDAVGADKDGRLSIDWGVYGVPETFIVNPAGVITYKHIGPMTMESLEKEVIPAIEKAKDD